MTSPILFIAAVSLTACGGSDSSQKSLEPQTGTVSLVAAREGDSTVLTASGPVAPKVVVPDEALPAGVSSDDLTGSVTYLTDPASGVTAVEFSMGPDGTEFVAPVELSWIGRTDDNVTTAIAALGDNGENLLAEEEAMSILDGVTSKKSGDDGTGSVSMNVTHFSKWIVIQSDDRLDTIGYGAGTFITSTVRLKFEYWRTSRTMPEGVFELAVDYETMGNSLSREACLNPTITMSGPASYYMRAGNTCGTRYDARSFYLKCPDTTSSGTITVDFTAYVGMSGLAPSERLVVLFGSTQRSPDNGSANEDAFVATSDLAIFMKGRLTRPYNCADGAESEVTAPSSMVETTDMPPTTPPATTVVTGSSTTTASTTGSTPATTAPRNNSTSSSTSSTVVRSGSSSSTVASSSSTTSSTYPSSSVPTTPGSAAPAGTWLRNDSRCSWRGTGSCGVYSSGSANWEEVGPAGNSGSTFTPIAGTAGQLAYNLYSGNSISNCDWNGSGGCGYYFTGSPGTLNLGPLG